MSTKLNAEELAEERFPRYGSVAEALAYNPGVELHPRRLATEVYAAAVREVAQPIADERDEAVELLRTIQGSGRSFGDPMDPIAIANYERINTFFVKYPKQ